MGVIAAAVITTQVIKNNNSHQPQSPQPPPSPDYSDAMMVESDNSKTTALAQIQSQEFAMQQASLDREMQNAANLELGLEKFDTSLQTSKLDYVQNMTSESDRHRERMAEIENGRSQAAASAASAAVPEPVVSDFLDDK